MSLQVLDTGTRADENPLSFGGRWTTGVLTGTALKLVSGEFRRQAATGTFGRDGSYWNNTTFAAGVNCQAGATLTSVGADSDAGIWLFNPAAATGYALNIQVAEIDLWRNDAGSVATVDRTTTVTGTAGDVYVLQIVGTDIIGWLYRSGAWTEILGATDSTYRPAFNAGLEIAGQFDVNQWRFDNFGANIVPPAGDAFLPRALPLIYMRKNR